ncbi:aldehyde dehydrogenase [Thozetella sp. PMI_491]|nr:aldehyde dehydrogenase [Thozetella sp. PMI_491]
MADYTVPFYLNGEEVRSAKTFDVVSPATGNVVHKSSAASLDDVATAVSSSATALKTWRKSLPKTRRDIFLKAAEVFERRRDELGEYIAAEIAGDKGWADFNINQAKELIIDVAGRLSDLDGSIPTPQDANTGALILKEPYGVVLAIAPWNAPYILGIRAVVFPIAAGNTVILKGSELSPRVFWAIASVLHEAGLPAGVLNFIVHDRADAPAITQALIANPEIKKINFTGSTAVGRVIAKLAGENLKPVLLELGGKAPAIVWEDADLDKAAFQCALGALVYAGQVCMSTERIIVHKNVRAEFETKLRGAIDMIYNPSADAPVLIQGAAVEKNKQLIQDALAKGASVLYGDVAGEETTKTRMRPIVITNVKDEMDIYKTESFGPTVAVYEIETEEEALRIANDTEYGLSSAVFTEDLRRGLRLAKEIETGAVHINMMSVHDETALPHGGAKGSGYGRFNSIGLAEWVRTKNITYQI